MEEPEAEVAHGPERYWAGDVVSEVDLDPESSGRRGPPLGLERSVAAVVDPSAPVWGDEGDGVDLPCPEGGAAS